MPCNIQMIQCVNNLFFAKLSAIIYVTNQKPESGIMEQWQQKNIHRLLPFLSCPQTKLGSFYLPIFLLTLSPPWEPIHRCQGGKLV